MQTNIQVVLTILTIAFGTILTRALPFAIFPPNRKTPNYILYLGTVLPFSIIGMLIVYCFQSTPILSWPYGLPELIAGLFVVAAHKLRHNLLLSVGGGTVLYMILVQYVFH